LRDPDPDPAVILLQEDPGLPLALATSFALLCRRTGTDAFASHAALLRIRRLQLLELGEKQEIDLETALAIADGLLAALDRSSSLTDCERRLLGGGVEYFLLIGDEQPDLATPDGFEDDRLLANAVFSAIGRPELRVPELPRARRWSWR
jgi:hypothetical protein